MADLNVQFEIKVGGLLKFPRVLIAIVLLARVLPRRLRPVAVLRMVQTEKGALSFVAKAILTYRPRPDDSKLCE